MKSLDHTFAALSDPTRRAILARLAAGDAIVGDLAAPFAISLPAISRHLRVLEDAGLIRREPDGKQRRCQLRAQPLADAFGWLEFYQQFWSEAFGRLDAHLKRKKR